MYVCMYVFMFACMYASMYVCVYVCWTKLGWDFDHWKLCFYVRSISKVLWVWVGRQKTKWSDFLSRWRLCFLLHLPKTPYFQRPNRITFFFAWPTQTQSIIAALTLTRLDRYLALTCAVLSLLLCADWLHFSQSDSNAWISSLLLYVSFLCNTWFGVWGLTAVIMC